MLRAVAPLLAFGLVAVAATFWFVVPPGRHGKAPRPVAAEAPGETPPSRADEPPAPTPPPPAAPLPVVPGARLGVRSAPALGEAGGEAQGTAAGGPQPVVGRRVTPPMGPQGDSLSPFTQAALPAHAQAVQTATRMAARDPDGAARFLVERASQATDPDVHDVLQLVAARLLADHALPDEARKLLDGSTFTDRSLDGEIASLRERIAHQKSEAAAARSR